MKKKTGNFLATFFTVLLILAVFPVVANATVRSQTPGKVTLKQISSPAYNKITIKWNRTSNATHYKIYYKKAGTSKWTSLVAVNGSTTSYTHTASKSKPLIVGQKYTYTVKGYNSRYKTYGSCNTKGLTTYTKPATVKLGRASLAKDKKSVTITWNKAAGCNYYCIYRRTETTKWKRLANLRTSFTSYTDKNPIPGKKNIYTVRSYYSPTAIYGNCDSKGIAVDVPKNSEVHKHSYTSTITRQPTCSTEGVLTYKCSCGDSYTEVIPATRKHIWQDMGTDIWMDWSYAMQENTGPTAVSFVVNDVDVCTGCGYYYGSDSDEDFFGRLLDHVETSENEFCGGGYTLLPVYEVHHLLVCRDCGIYKCGNFSHYEYIFTWHGRNDHIKLEDWQIKELGLPLDGTVKITP